MVRNFIWSWIIAALVVVGAASCSDSHDDGDGEPSLRGGDVDGDGIPDDEDDSDDDGIPDSEDDDIDGDGIPNDEDEDADGDGVPDDLEGPGGDPRDPGGAAGSGGGSVPVPGAIPMFPGAGTSNAGDPLPNGMLCDSVPGQDLPIAGGGTSTCFFDKNDPTNTQVAATLEQVLECVEGTDTIHLRLTFHPWFVDNSYGANSIGWPPRRGHRWTDLTKSDHAEFILKDEAGNVVMQFKLDYVTEDPSAPSGYGSLGVTGGDGSVAIGDASAVLDWNTSISRNFNERGYTDYLPPAGSDVADSPATDENYTPNPDAPEWDFRVVYEVWIDASIFGSSGFGGALIEYVHASPAKASTDTIETTPGECPPPPPPGCPDNDPDTFCGEGGSGGGGTSGNGGTGGSDGPPPPGCVDNDPDTFCGEGGSGGGGTGGTGGTGGSGGDGPPPPGCVDNDPDTFCGEGGSGGGGTGGRGGSGGSGGSGGDGSSGSGGTNGGDPGPCEDGDPDTYCGSGGNGGDPLDPCQDNDPDTVCGGGGTGPGGDPQYCSDHPEDPVCMVD